MSYTSVVRSKFRKVIKGVVEECSEEYSTESGRRGHREDDERTRVVSEVLIIGGISKGLTTVQ